MKYFGTLLLCLVFVSGFAGGMKKKKKGKAESKKMELKTELDSLSYSIGINIAQNLKSQGIDSINSNAMAVAMQHVIRVNTINPVRFQILGDLNSY